MVANSDNRLDTKETVECVEFKDKPEWLTEELFREFLLTDFPNFQKISQFHIEPAVTAGENYMTIMLRVRLEVVTVDGNTKSTSYMVKIKPRTEQMQTMVKDWQVFEKEQLTYSKYLPKFEDYYRKAGKEVVFAPRALSPTRVHINDDAVILEDLRLKGFKNFNRHLGMDMTHTKAVLKKLAEFHAASAFYAQSEADYPPMYDQCLVGDDDTFADYRYNVCRMLCENLPIYGDVQHLEEKLKTYGGQQFDPFQQKSERSSREFYVLNHGDLWVNNIMFQYNADGCLNETYFIDFQMGRYGSPAQDLIYFILSSTSIDIKFEHFDYFISYYHRHLIENLQLLHYQGKVPKLRDLHISLFEHDYWAYTTLTVLLPVVVCEPREDANTENMLDNEDNDFRRVLYSNPKFAEHMRIGLPWLENRGALDL